MKTMKRPQTVAWVILPVALILSTPAFSQSKTKLTDPEVASIAVTANQIDISYAELAKTKSKDAEILKFAETMATDHKAVIDQAVALVTKLNVTPKDNAVSKQLQADAEKTRKSLASKSGAAFDKAYIDNEVAYHKAVISVLESRLIPESQNKELKDLLTNVMPAFKAHLSHAEMVQKKFAK
jgi:putative membrane protein